MPTPIIIDTDPGIDDAMAILLALRAPELDVRALTVVHGNSTVEQCTRNARRVLNVAGRCD
ncbi:MAG: nucleoside hydrolase, partial [Chloroflexi bacterium]|nr:nucleoside hydrolase [Chloroflexota bacterium]